MVGFDTLGWLNNKNRHYMDQTICMVDYLQKKRGTESGLSVPLYILSDRMNQSFQQGSSSCISGILDALKLGLLIPAFFCIL